MPTVLYHNRKYTDTNNVINDINIDEEDVNNDTRKLTKIGITLSIFGLGTWYFVRRYYEFQHLPPSYSVWKTIIVSPGTIKFLSKILSS